MGMGFALNDLEVDPARLCQARVCFRVPPACQRQGGLLELLECPGGAYDLDEVSPVHR